ncbi:ROK family protein [Olivibacter sitiensis]|uniref:ROK family protein n=1 Tax=Olivibacter sitiensis TaxID=376470 RepID=UPI000420A772|nr:ROK family protein [Olivibacter sitiensis]
MEEVTSKKRVKLMREIIRQLYFNNALSVNELAKLTGKSLPVIAETIGSLIRDGWAETSDFAQSTGGRRATQYKLDTNAGYSIIAVAMDQFITRVVAYNLNNEIIAPIAEYELLLTDEKSTCVDLISIVNDYINTLSTSRDKIIGVGIAMPGFVNAEQGINRSFLGYGQQSLVEVLAPAIGLPVFIDNDSTAIALAELYFGAAKGMRDVMVVNVGWGIGLGMIVKGELFRGHSGYAGEFSHIPLADGDDLCSCGKRGCLEVDSSLLVITRRAQEELSKGTASMLKSLFDLHEKPTGEEVLLAANNGDQLAISLLAKAGFIIGKGIATLIHIMNPQAVVISGRGAIASKSLMAPVYQAVNEFCIPLIAEQTKLIASSLNKEAELIGAATLVMERSEIIKANN